MKKISFLMTLSFLTLYSCSHDDSIAVDGNMTSGAVEIEKNGEYITVHNETLTMPADRDEMIIEFRSSGVYDGSSDFRIFSSSGEIKAELIDPIDRRNPRKPDDSVYRSGDGAGGTIYDYFYHQKVRVTAPGENAGTRSVKFRIVTHECNGKYSDFSVIKPGKK